MFNDMPSHPRVIPCTVAHTNLFTPRAQGVHTMFEGAPDRKWLPGEERVSKMVFIGKELDKEAFTEAFANCVVKEAVKA